MSKQPKLRLWTAGELSALERLLRVCPTTAHIYAELPQRPPSGIAHKAACWFPKLWDKFRRPTRYEDGRQPWRDWELAKLARMLKTCTSTEQIYERFSMRPPSGIQKQASKSFPELWQKFARKYKLQPFTPEEDAVILACYGHPETSAAVIAKMLSRSSRREIIGRATRLRKQGKLDFMRGRHKALDNRKAPV